MSGPQSPGAGAGAAEGWKCSDCGRPCSAPARFCPSCGTPRPFPSRCPNCSAALRTRQAFCAQCGVALPPFGLVDPERPSTAATGSGPQTLPIPATARSSNQPAQHPQRPRAELARAHASGGSAVTNLALGAIVFLLAAALLTLLAGRVIGPAIIGDTPIADLRGAARALTLVLFAGIAVAGFLSGASVAWRGRKGPMRFASVMVLAASGPLGGVMLLVAISYAARLPIEARSTAVNAIVAVVGAVAGAGFTSLLPGRPDTVVAAEGVSNAFGVVALLCVAMTITHMTAPGQGMRATAAMLPRTAFGDPLPARSESPNDIEKSDCALSAQETKLTAALTVFSLDVGPAWTFAQKKLPDNKWQDTVDVGLKAGFELVVGQHLLTRVLGAKGGEGLSISAGTHAALDVTSTYKGLEHGRADDVIRWSLNRYGLSALALPGLTQLVLPTLKSQPAVRDVAAPTSSEVKLGGTISFDLKAGAGISYKASLEVGDHAAVALNNDGNTDRNYVSNPTSVEFALGLTGSGSAAALAPIGGGLSGHLQGDGVLSMEFKKAALDLWVPESVKLQSTYEMTGAADMEFAGRSLLSDAADKKSVLTRIFNAAKASNSDERGASLEVTGSVDVEAHPEVLVAGVEIINAAQNASKHTPSASQRARYNAAIHNLASLIDKNAVLRGKVYDVTAGTAGIDIEAGDGLAFGASVERESTAETLIGGFYRDEAHFWRASDSCRTGV